VYGSDPGTSPGPLANLAIQTSIDPPLLQMLMASQIVPGADPSYALCKLIFEYHPLGATLTANPITLAQSQERTISVPGLGEERVVQQFRTTWAALGQLPEHELGKLSATALIHSLVTQSRMYGVATLVAGEQGKALATPLDLNEIGGSDLFFNVLDPLTTAGSLVLDLNPRSPKFLKPTNVYVQGEWCHPSRVLVKMNEFPIYLAWSNPSFGFVGRSIYQRGLYPLKSFIQSMVTDQMVIQKSGLLVAKMRQPGSIIDGVMGAMFGQKRGQVKAGVTGQVLGIAVDEEIESLNLQNLEKPFELARTNVLKNIATACGMPAALVNNETLTEGFGEGTEDAKQIARYLDWCRQDMARIYSFLDRIVMRKAWDENFYKTMQRAYPEYAAMKYETAFYEWQRLFKATWPNLLTEPDSEKAKREKEQFDAVVEYVKEIAPLLDPKNKAGLIEWASANVNAAEELFAGRLDFDVEALEDFLETEIERQQDLAEAAAEGPDEKGGNGVKPTNGKAKVSAT
jgi:hypothetical protein